MSSHLHATCWGWGAYIWRAINEEQAQFLLWGKKHTRTSYCCLIIVVASLSLHHCCCIIVVASLSLHHCRRIIVIASLLLHHCRRIIVVTSLSSHHCRRIIVVIAQCTLHHFWFACVWFEIIQFRIVYKPTTLLFALSRACRGDTLTVQLLWCLLVVVHNKKINRTTNNDWFFCPPCVDPVTLSPIINEGYFVLSSLGSW